ncbi:MAG: hypothetical protein R3B82_12445 [Sandaracinaceae bacterium]
MSEVVPLGARTRIVRTIIGRNPGWYGRSVQSSSSVVASAATRPAP